MTALGVWAGAELPQLRHWNERRQIYSQMGVVSQAAPLSGVEHRTGSGAVAGGETEDWLGGVKGGGLEVKMGLGWPCLGTAEADIL